MVTMGMLNISPAKLRKSMSLNTAGGAVPLGIPIMSMCAWPDNMQLCSNEYHMVLRHMVRKGPHGLRSTD